MDQIAKVARIHVSWHTAFGAGSVLHYLKPE